MLSRFVDASINNFSYLENFAQGFFFLTTVAITRSNPTKAGDNSNCSRIKEEKEDEYSNSVAKIQVCAMFRAGDIQRNVLLKFIRLRRS